MKQKSMSLGSSLKRTEIKSINGGVTVDDKIQQVVKCTSYSSCSSGYAKIYPQTYICCH